jgi:GNAT superfamily N-acetyltransferase
VIVREMRRSDTAQVSHEMQVNFGEELQLKGWDPDHFSQIIDRSFSFPAGPLLAVLRAFRRSPVHLFVAEEDHRVVGTTFLFFQRSHGYIAAVMTDPAFRGRGFASALLQRSEDACRRRHRRWAVLDVIQGNKVARDLYIRRGYRPLRVQRWLVRDLGQPREAFGPDPSGVRPMEKKDLQALLDLYVGQQPPEVREVLAPERQHIAPPHYMQTMMPAVSAAWCTGPVGAPTGYVRSIFTTPKQAGNLSAPLLAPRSSPLERAALLRTGLAWLAGQGASRVVSEVPDHNRDGLALLREAGFEERWAMDTLLLTLDGSAPRA